MIRHLCSAVTIDIIQNLSRHLNPLKFSNTKENDCYSFFNF